MEMMNKWIASLKRILSEAKKENNPYLCGFIGAELDDAQEEAKSYWEELIKQYNEIKEEQCPASII